MKSIRLKNLFLSYQYTMLSFNFYSILFVFTISSKLQKH